MTRTDRRARTYQLRRAITAGATTPVPVACWGCDGPVANFTVTAGEGVPVCTACLTACVDILRSTDGSRQTR